MPNETSYVLATRALADLHPRLTFHENGELVIAFDCPAIGHRHRIRVPVSEQTPLVRGCWALHTPLVADARHMWAALTLTPSIFASERDAEGNPLTTCWHGWIRDGALVDA